MKTSLILLLCLFVIIFLRTGCFGQNFEQKIDSLVKPLLSSESPGGTALVVKDGEILYKKAFGLADLESAVVMKPDHVFRIGSITKQFTAFAIMKLAEQGKLSLQDSITRFIKEYPTNGFVITIENLLTHTSGIKNITGMPTWTSEVQRKDLSPKELVNFFKNEPIEFSPGSAYRYSNSNYILLGYIIELVTGSTYGQFLSETFFQPLGMTNSGYDNFSAIIIDRVKGYQKINGQYKNADFLSMTQPFSAGAIVSNTRDLYTWYNSIMTHKLVGKEYLKKAQARFMLSSGQLTSYGYGWELGNIQGSPAVRHGGKINGFITSSVYLPDEKVFVAIFSNCDCTNGVDDAASKIAAIAIGKPYEWLPIKTRRGQLEEYEGVYETEQKDERVIALEDGRLLYFPRKRGKSQLVPFNKDRFHIENSLMSIHFNRDKNGKIKSFVLESTESSIVWDRTEKEVNKFTAVKIPPEALVQYVGRYQFGSSYFEVIKEENKLYGKAPGNDQIRQEILPFGKHKFFARNLDAQIIFNVDEKEKVIGLTLIQNGERKAAKID
jgi:CubicO group peptidase (beta-lactamase class C family)